MGLRRFLKPSVLLWRKALRSGVFGGQKGWFRIFAVMFVWKRLKSLFGFGDPQPVLVEEAGPGQRFVIAHEDNAKSRKAQRKSAKKASKKSARTDAKAAKKLAKAAVRAAKH